MVSLLLDYFCKFCRFHFVSSQRSLVAVDENINNAMSRIGVALTSRWDAHKMIELENGKAGKEKRCKFDTFLQCHFLYFLLAGDYT